MMAELDEFQEGKVDEIESSRKEERNAAEEQVSEDREEFDEEDEEDEEDSKAHAREVGPVHSAKKAAVVIQPRGEEKTSVSSRGEGSRNRRTSVTSLESESESESEDETITFGASGRSRHVDSKRWNRDHRNNGGGDNHGSYDMEHLDGRNGDARDARGGGHDAENAHNQGQMDERSHVAIDEGRQISTTLETRDRWKFDSSRHSSDNEDLAVGELAELDQKVSRTNLSREDR